MALLASVLASCGVVPGDTAARLGRPERAAKFYQSEANRGNADAALRLGLLIDKREVSAATYGSALSWFKEACRLGSMEAYHNVGVAYEFGTHGLSKDYVQAEAYYFKAAAAGFMLSQYNLGSLYANNHISPPDDLEGLKWILLAQMSAARDTAQPLSSWVLQDLPDNKRRLEMRLSDVQLQEARTLAETWKPTTAGAER